jgi:Tfp pilus assembly protein PilN
MINLLPPDMKRDMHYGRRDMILLHWIFACLVALAGVGLIVGAGFFYLQHSISNQTASLKQSQETLKAQKVDETQKKLSDISSDTKLILQVLSREILFSKLLTQLGASLPENTTLDELEIDKVQGGLTLKSMATDINAATQLQLNLQDPTNKIFDKADIENISCVPPDPQIKYPCTVQLRAQFAKDNPYVYISPAAGGTKK